MSNTRRCSDCGHSEFSHRYESGFYDVPSGRQECDVIGCPCRRYRAEIKRESRRGR